MNINFKPQKHSCFNVIFFYKNNDDKKANKSLGGTVEKMYSKNGKNWYEVFSKYKARYYKVKPNMIDVGACFEHYRKFQGAVKVQ